MQNQTEIIDQGWQDRRVTNQINAVYRHCRIGKVKPKNWKAAAMLYSLRGSRSSYRSSYPFNQGPSWVDPAPAY